MTQSQYVFTITLSPHFQTMEHAFHLTVDSSLLNRLWMYGWHANYVATWIFNTRQRGDSITSYSLNYNTLFLKLTLLSLYRYLLLRPPSGVQSSVVCVDLILNIQTAMCMIKCILVIIIIATVFTRNCLYHMDLYGSTIYISSLLKWS